MSLAPQHGGVSELADEHDLGSCAERLGGSSPPFPIKAGSVVKYHANRHFSKESSVCDTLNP